jgi:hypothetical protein
MRLRSLATAAALLTIGTAAQAQTTDIPFGDIFRTLSAKVSRTSDKAFFDTEVLQGRAARSPSRYGIPDSWDYAYGEGKGSSYTEATAAGSEAVFFASDFSDSQTCLTLGEAQDQLAKDGWSQPAPGDAPPSTTGENVGTAYMRGGVTFEISNFFPLMPIVEPWNPPEVTQKQFDDMNKYGQERLAIKPGSDAFRALCLTSLKVTFTR